MKRIKRKGKITRVYSFFQREPLNELSKGVLPCEVCRVHPIIKHVDPCNLTEAQVTKGNHQAVSEGDQNRQRDE